MRLVLPDLELVELILMRVLFPLMIVSLVCLQQPAGSLLGVIGQLTSIGALLVAQLTVIACLPARVWPLALLGAMLILRGGRLVLVDSSVLELLYTIVAAGVFSAAGALILIRRPSLLPRQVVWVCALCVPIMVLQASGVGVTQLLRTDLESAYGFQQVATLFQPLGSTVIGIQARPSGIFYANNVASVIVVLGLGIYYGSVQRSRPTWSDAAVLGTVVLLMSKLAFAGIAVVLCVRLFMSSSARRHALASMAMLVVFLGVYRVLFPGLFSFNLSWRLWANNMQYRLADLLLATGSPRLRDLTAYISPDVMQHLDATAATQSGYAAVVAHAQCLLPSVVLAIPYIWMAGRRVRGLGLEPATAQRAFLVAALALLAPLATSPLQSYVFWFLAAAAFVPMWLIAEPDFAAAHPPGIHQGLASPVLVV